jgi:predicted kinase
MTQALYLIRGVSGSGKTTFANRICDCVISADDFFMKDGVYCFNPRHLSIAHGWCQEQVKLFLTEGKTVAVANTFTEEWEMEEYFRIAEKFNLPVFSIIVENRHGNKNVHDVPLEVINRQASRFDVKLF